MSHAILFFVYNQTEAQLQLTKNALRSVYAQDIGDLKVWIVNNGSNAETVSWLNSLPSDCPSNAVIHGFHYAKNISPVLLINKYLSEIFRTAEYVLCVPNDVVLPPNLYTEMLRWDQGIVAAGMHGSNPPVVMATEEISRIHGDVHVSVPLVRRWAFNAVVEHYGFFHDPRYCSDCDLKLRLAELKVSTAQLDILCWHFESASIRLAPEYIAQDQHRKAGIDRAYFELKWGFAVGSPQYERVIRELK